MSRQKPAESARLKPGRTGFTLRQLVTMLWSQRLTVAVIVGVALLGTWLSARLTAKAFEATATVLVTLQMKEAAAPAFPEPLAQAYVARQTETVRTREVLARAVDRLDLPNVAGFMGEYDGADDASARREWATQQLGDRVSVALVEGHFIAISARDTDPTRAADLANAVSDAFVDVQRQLNVEPDRERVARFDEGLDRLRLKVDEVQAKVGVYAARHGGHVPATAGGEDSAQQMDLDRRLFEARARRQQAELRLRGMGKDDTSVPGAQAIHNLQNQLAEKQAALKKLEPLLGERDPQYRSFEAEIAETRAKLYEVIVTYQQGLRADADAARAMEQKLERERAQRSGAALDAQFSDGEGAALMRELNAASQAYQAALDNIDVARLGAGLPNSSASVVTRAVPPLGRARPPLEHNLLLALAFGALAGLIVALLRELLYRRVRSSEDFERNLGIPVLAEVGTGGAP